MRQIGIVAAVSQTIPRYPRQRSNRPPRSCPFQASLETGWQGAGGQPPLHSEGHPDSEASPVPPSGQASCLDSQATICRHPVLFEFVG